MASLLNRLWSRADFWDKEENEKQKQQFAAQTRAQSQPRPVAQTRPAQKITDNTPGFQWSNNSLTRGLSRGFDQLNPFDNNRTWQQRTPTDTLSLVQEAKQKINTPSQPDKYWSNGIGKTINTGIAGTMRAAAGVGQDTAGLYDLLTPGKGTNRVTKYFKNRGAMWDEKAKEAGVDGMGYHVAQAPLTVASYMVPGKAVKAASAVPRVAKAVSVASNVLEKAPGAAKATGYVDDLVANGNRLQRVGGKLLQSYRQPSAILDVVGDALQNAGHRTSLGQDNSLGTAMQDMGLSLGMQGGVNLLGQAASPVLNTTTRLAKNTINTIAPQQTTTRLVKRPGRLDLQTADLLKAYSDRIVGADPSITGRVESDLIRQVRQIGDELGVDLTNGTPVDQLERIEAILKGYLPQQQTARRLALQPLNEGGYARNPFYRGDDVAGGKNVDPLESLKQEARYYHGSTNDKLTSLQPGSKTGLNEKRNLIYLTDDPETAKPYTKNRGTDGSGQGVLTDSKTGKVYEVQVEGKTIGAYDFEELAKLKNAKGFNELSGKTKNSITNDTGLSAEVLEANPELRNFLIQNGYTNVKAHLPNGTGKSNEIIVLDPSKAKLSQPPKSTPVQKVEIPNGSNWRDTVDSQKFGKDADTNANILADKQKDLRAIASGSKSDNELADVLSRAEQLHKEGYLGDNANLAWDIMQNPASSKATKARATKLYKDITKPALASQPTKGANIPPSQAVNNKAPVEPVQGRNPTQSQTADTGPLQTVERPVLNPAHKTTEVSQKTPPVEKSQVRSDRTSSSDDIIDLDKVDVNDPFGNSSPVKKLRNEFGRMFVDEDSEMINLLKRVEKETDGQDLVERWLQDSDMVRNSNSIANSKIRTNQNLRDAVQGLRKKEVAEFDAYAAARSELANVKRGLETTSRSVDELQNIVNKHGQKYSQRFESLNRYYNDLANDLYDAGIIDKAKRDAWAKNKDYVRVQRDMEDLLNPGYGASKSRSFGSTSTARKRTGSKRDILSSTQTALKRTQELQLEIQRNKAASNTLDVLEKHGLATKVNSSHAAGKNVIKRFKDGKVEYFATHKDIKRVMDNVNPFQLGIIAKVVSAPTRVFRAGTTALSAPFAVTNYLRDQASSAIYSKSVLRTHNPVAIISGITQGVKDFGGGKNNELWDKFQRYAGDQTMFDETRNVKNSKAMLNQLRRGGGKYARTVELINPANTVRNLEDLISITEKSTRYQNFRGIYKKTLKETGNEDLAIQKATQAALQNSVNFSRAGSVVRVANLLIPYFNAGIQGSRNVGRSLRDRPLQTVAKSAAFVAAPTIGAVLYNYSSEGSKRIYENLPENEKENNIVFVLPGAKQREDGTYEGILKIPKPQGYRELTDPLRVVAEKFAGDTDVKSIGEMAKDMTAAFTGPVQTEDMNKFLSTFVPQALKPTLQAHLNRDLYWGSETVPDYMMEGTDDPTKRAYKGTSGMARWVADQLGVEPIKVEKFIIDSAGSLGRYGINAVDNTLAAQGKIPKEQIGGRSIKDDFSRRMFEARGVEKEEKNMTDGQKYFKAVKEATTGLSPQQKTAWDSYNQSNKDFLGNELYDKSSFAKKQAKAAAYAQFPGLFETDKKIDAQGRQRGEPGNPLYDLNFNQAFKVVQQKAMLPGAKDPELDSLYDHAWYEEFKAKESNYYDKVFADKKDEDLDNPYPKRSEQLTAAMNHYYDLDTSQRRAWRNANPGLYDQFKQYYAAKDAWEDRERIKIGLGPISQYKNSQYGSGSGGGRTRKLSFEPFKFGKKSSHLNKELRALIEEAGRTQKAFPKAKKTKNYS